MLIPLYFLCCKIPIVFSRLVTGLMDKLEQKLGRDGLRTRVRTVASQAAKVRGKENLRASCDGAGGSKTVSSPLRTAAAADNVQAPSPGRKKWGPPRSPNDLIPKIGEFIAEENIAALRKEGRRWFHSKSFGGKTWTFTFSL